MRPINRMAIRIIGLGVTSVIIVPRSFREPLAYIGDDKHLHTQEDDIMDDIDPQTGSDMRLDAQRDIIRQSLDAIINDIEMAMRDVGLTPSTSPFATLGTRL